MAESKVKKIAVEEEAARRQDDSLTRLVRSALRAGVSMAILPIALLPDASQQHIRRAGSEFTLGLAELLRSASKALDNEAKEI